MFTFQLHYTADKICPIRYHFAGFGPLQTQTTVTSLSIGRVELTQGVHLTHSTCGTRDTKPYNPVGENGTYSPNSPNTRYHNPPGFRGALQLYNIILNILQELARYSWHYFCVAEYKWLRCITTSQYKLEISWLHISTSSVSFYNCYSQVIHRTTNEFFSNIFNYGGRKGQNTFSTRIKHKLNNWCANLKTRTQT